VDENGSDKIDNNNKDFLYFDEVSFSDEEKKI
jgi:hypothetical protein